MGCEALGRAPAALHQSTTRDLGLGCIPAANNSRHIEEIRGVGVSSNIVRTLLDREWIRVVGHRDVPGRPAMFATTKQFLDYFNLKSLQDLPPLSEIKDLAVADPEFDLEDDLAGQRILELPEEVVDENSIELTESDKADLIAEEEAVALSKKPLDEILKLPPELQYPSVEDDDTEEPDAEDLEFEEEFGIKELDETLDSLEAVDIKSTESESMESFDAASQEESTEIEFSVNDDNADTKIQH